MSKKKDDLFRIPAPSKEDGEYKFYPIVRVGRIVPFGYKQDPEDSQVLLPIEEELLLFEAAKIHLKSYSLRDVSKWLSAKSGRYISHVGLRARVMQEQNIAKEYIDAKRIAGQFQEAYYKAKRIECSRLGLREPTEEEMDDELFKSAEKSLHSRYKKKIN